MKSLLAFSCCLLLLTSCYNSRYAYSPNAHNTPQFTKQGDTKLAAMYSNNGISTLYEEDGNSYSRTVSHGYDLQGAIAATNHLAVIASYSSRTERQNDAYSYGNFDSSTIKYKRNLIELGGGYFTAIDRKKRAIFQVMGGVAFGKTKINDSGKDYNTNSPYSRYYNMNVTKYFIEPGFTFKAKEIFAASIVTRMNLLQFSNINTSYSLQERQDLRLDSLNRYATFLFEPAFVASFGFNKAPGFRITLQTGISAILDNNFFDYRPFNFSIGLAFDIPKMIKGVSKDK